jgi:hypothetical protein
MTPNVALLKTLTGILASLLFIVVLLFAGAGRLNWELGWLFVAVWGLLKLVFILFFYAGMTQPCWWNMQPVTKIRNSRCAIGCSRASGNYRRYGRINLFGDSGSNPRFFEGLFDLNRKNQNGTDP